jgi:hypothetical protein
VIFFSVIKQYERAVVFRLSEVTGEARGLKLYDRDSRQMVSFAQARTKSRGKHEPLAKRWTPDAGNGRHAPAPERMASLVERPRHEALTR